MSGKTAELQAVQWANNAETSEGNSYRIPAQGRAAPDGILNGKWTVEVKTRSSASFPQWLLKAFDQARQNRAEYPDLEDLVLVSVRFGTGYPNRWFLCKEVYPMLKAKQSKGDDFEVSAGSINRHTYEFADMIAEGLVGEEALGE